MDKTSRNAPPQAERDLLAEQVLLLRAGYLVAFCAAAQSRHRGGEPRGATKSLDEKFVAGFFTFVLEASSVFSWNAATRVDVLMCGDCSAGKVCSNSACELLCATRACARWQGDSIARTFFGSPG